MVFLKCEIDINKPDKCVTRIVGSSVQTLIREIDEDTEVLRLLLGADSLGGLSLGPPLELYKARTAGDDSAAPWEPFEPDKSIECPIWDCWSASVYALYGKDIIRITAGNEVSLLVVSDGEGDEADFHDCVALASDGAGALYVSELKKLKKVQLPAALQSSAVTGATGSAAGPNCKAVVSTLPFEAANNIYGGLLHVPDPSGGPGSLVYGTLTALYRVQLGSEGDAISPVLLAGQEGHPDVQGEEARFVSISGITMDAEGRIIVADQFISDETTTHVRCVTSDGAVNTLIAHVDGLYSGPLILPNGCLAMCDEIVGQLVVLGLGLKPRPLTPPTPNNNEPQPGSLPADWGAMLAQAEATSDLTLEAGGRVFPVHRLVLTARCEYFRRCLAEGAFAEGTAAQLELPDADPDALACVIRFIYTGVVDIPATLVCPVAELADRLMLPMLTTTVCKQLWAGVAPGTVVDMLLWAERCAVRGGSFVQLLTDLKTWYVEHYEDVKEEARGSQQRLTEAASLDLMMDLQDRMSARAEGTVSKRPRIR